MVSQHVGSIGLVDGDFTMNVQVSVDWAIHVDFL